MRDMRTIFFFFLVSFSRKKIGHLERWWIIMCAIYYFCNVRLLNRRTCLILFWLFFFNQIYYVLFILIMASEYMTASVCVCACAHACVNIVRSGFILFCFGPSGVMKNSYLFLYGLSMCVSYVIYSSSLSLFSLSLLIPTTVFVLLKFNGAK